MYDIYIFIFIITTTSLRKCTRCREKRRYVGVYEVTLNDLRVLFCPADHINSHNRLWYQFQDVLLAPYVTFPEHPASSGSSYRTLDRYRVAFLHRLTRISARVEEKKITNLPLKNALIFTLPSTVFTATSSNTLNTYRARSNCTAFATLMNASASWMHLLPAPSVAEIFNAY